MIFVGSFFPPRDQTGANIVHVWDKDLCRTLPLQYRGPVEKAGIKADLYTPPDLLFGRTNETPSMEDECFCSDGIATCPPRGLQDISPCQYSKCSRFYKINRILRHTLNSITIYAFYFRCTSIPLVSTFLQRGF